MNIVKCCVVIVSLFFCAHIGAASDQNVPPLIIHHHEFVSWCKKQGHDVSEIHCLAQSSNTDVFEFLITEDASLGCDGMCNESAVEIYNNLFDHLGLEFNEADDEYREYNHQLIVHPQHSTFSFPIVCNKNETSCSRWTEKVKTLIHRAISSYMTAYKSFVPVDRFSQQDDDLLNFYFLIQFDPAAEQLTIRYAPQEAYEGASKKKNDASGSARLLEHFDQYATLPLAVVALFGGLSLVDSAAFYLAKLQEQ